jgi:hypothetical protein
MFHSFAIKAIKVQLLDFADLRATGGAFCTPNDARITSWVISRNACTSSISEDME